MRARVIAILVCIALCLSFIPLLIPPMLEPAEAAPESLSLTFAATSFTNGSLVVLDLQQNDTIPQFGRRVPNTYTYTVQSGSTSYLSTVYSSVCDVTGGLNGTATFDTQTVDVSYPSGQAVGYIVGNWALGGYKGVLVGDTSAIITGNIVTKTIAGFVLAKSTAEVLIGTIDGTAVFNSTTQQMVSESGTMALRRYSSDEMKAVGTFNTTIASGTSGNEKTGTIPVGSRFLQFRPPLIVSSTGTMLYYNEGMSGTAQGSYGGEAITITSVGNSLSFWTGTPPRTGWGAGTAVVTIGSNSGHAVYVDGGPGWAYGEASSTGYGIGVAEYCQGTGFMAGKDGYNEYTSVTTGGVTTTTNTFYGYGAADVSTPPGNAILFTDSGALENLTSVSESDMPSDGKPEGLLFPYGFFQFEITDLTPGQSVTLFIYLPSAAPAIAQYWKYGPTSTAPAGEWYQIAMGNNDGDNAITITLTDGGLGDDIFGIQDGMIVDQGGPGWPGPTGGGASSAPVFPSVYIGIGAALGAGLAAYALRRRLAAR